jgi:hypothetical protein
LSCGFAACSGFLSPLRVKVDRVCFVHTLYSTRLAPGDRLATTRTPSFVTVEHRARLRDVSAVVAAAHRLCHVGAAAAAAPVRRRRGCVARCRCFSSPRRRAARAPRRWRSPSPFSSPYHRNITCGACRTGGWARRPRSRCRSTTSSCRSATRLTRYETLHPRRLEAAIPLIRVSLE